MKKIISLLILLFLSFTILSSCTAKKDVEINLISEHGTLTESVIHAKRETIITLPELVDDDYEHLGWIQEGISDKIIFEYEVSKSDTKLTFKAFWIDKDPDPEIKEARSIKKAIDDIVKEDLHQDDLESLEELKTRYNALSDYPKTKVDNIAQLNEYIDLVKLLVKTEPVEELIDSLPRIIYLDDEEDVNLAKDEYDKLSSEEKLLVRNYSQLEYSLNRINAFKTLDSTKAKELNEKLLVLPYTITIDYYDDACVVLALYNELSTEEHILIDYPDYITRLKEDLYTLSSNDGVIYHLGKDNYFTRDELGQAWFKDFYKFIYTHGGIKKLESEKIYNVDKFLELAYSYTAGRGEMRYLGDTFSDYYLAKDVNGIRQNQPDTGFIGFCYKNNRYVDFIPFLEAFFSYWRIDEGYARTSNYGADFYADRWATLVDTCKFFYYTVDTSYVKTDRMKDCFNRCANVIITEAAEQYDTYVLLPYSVERRNYTIKGWYDNPELSGDSLWYKEYRGIAIHIYVKWEIDQSSLDQDQASLCDLYIYNLTTTKAVVNETTVRYVKDMYDALSDNGKALVNNVSTLNNLVDQYL